MPFPTFIIAGATRCGTTAMYNHLKMHPDICLSEIKEVNFFIKDLYFSSENKCTSSGSEWYSRHFVHCGKVKAVGEASPNYLQIEQAPRRIKEFLPSVKLIFLLRNPVDRAYSQYWQKVSNGVEFLSFEKAIEIEPKRIAEGDKFDFAYLYKGLYAIHLRRYLSLFSSRQILVLFTEDFKEKRVETLKILFKFLGVDSSVELTNLPKEQRNPAGAPRIMLINKLIHQLPGNRPFRNPPVRDLPFSRFSYKLMRKLLRMNRKFNIERPYPKMDSNMREKLSDYFKPYNIQLEELLGRALPWD